MKYYLPDKDDIDSDYIDRQFLFTVVNTLEPTFFRRALKEYHDITQNKRLKQGPVVEVD